MGYEGFYFIVICCAWCISARGVELGLL